MIRRYHLGGRKIRIEQTGVVRLPFLEDELLAHFASNERDPYGRQSAFWSKTYWAQFIVAAR